VTGNFLAHALRKAQTMSFLCQHCDELIIGNAYHVTSEEEGVPLLDMIVCETCASEAKCLQLNTEEITPEHIEAPAIYARLRV
jgi:RNase P subunit RPR2